MSAHPARGDTEHDLHRAALDALGDPNRRAIVEILSGGGQSVQQIADKLPISRPAVSRHLRLLKSAGLVSDQPDGTRRIYQLRDEGVEAVRQYFAEVWDQAVARFRIVAENTGAGAGAGTGPGTAGRPERGDR
jgi:DNA-binding transcriptional ArsR family regulator